MQTQSRGHDISYDTRGEGPGLLLVHGTLQSSRRWLDCGYPDEFADAFHVVMPDLLGHGQSAKPHEPEAYTVDGQIADLLAVLDAEGLPEVHVWGYSGGAVLAAALAARHPDRVLSLVLGGIPPNVEGDVRRAVTQPWIDALRSADWGQFWEVFLPLDAGTQRLLERQNDPVAVGAFVEGLAETASLFAPVEAPVLCYHGTAEVFFDLAEATAREIGAEFVPVEGLGHDEAFHRLDAVAPTVHDFLSRSVIDSCVRDR